MPYNQTINHTSAELTAPTIGASDIIVVISIDIRDGFDAATGPGACRLVARWDAVDSLTPRQIRRPRGDDVTDIDTFRSETRAWLEAECPEPMRTRALGWCNLILQSVDL